MSEDEWDRLCSSCYSPDIDPADLAERAQDAGIEYYMMLSGVKQTLLNITATTLYHLFEQQIIFLLRREILNTSEENNVQLMRVSVFKNKLREKGINIESFKSWKKIEELRLVSNSIKHAEGPSAVELREFRPDLFQPPMIRTQEEQFITSPIVTRVYLPLAGEDIFVTQEDLSEYKDALLDFWSEFINICLNYNYSVT
ncbi:hypothetical protein DRJ25_05825 [Candidatus Woesearchaeota archaeon]|nr:MAG: hypothetical protein DRJ25_05825 [Candidatus Woesearchaeota archaeon]